MGKYSDEVRLPRDFYPTPKKAVLPLAPYLTGVDRYAEPFAGDGRLITHLKELLPDMQCSVALDIDPQYYPALRIKTVDFNLVSGSDFTNTMIDSGSNAVITNPPWLNNSDSKYQLTRFCNKLCHSGFPVIMLLNANILNNQWFWKNKTSETPNGRSLGEMCYQILPIGRVKWIEDSPHTGKEDCAWFFFNETNTQPPKLLPRA